MGDLHERLTALKKCLDDELITNEEYHTYRNEELNSWRGSKLLLFDIYRRF
jgi:hypothetical protein